MYKVSFEIDRELTERDRSLFDGIFPAGWDRVDKFRATVAEAEIKIDRIEGDCSGSRLKIVLRSIRSCFEVREYKLKFLSEVDE